MDSEFECNVCGGNSFADFRNRIQVRCTSCGSLERTRVLKLVLDRQGALTPDMRVLHLAPEPMIGKHIKSIVGNGYDARDYSPDNFPKELNVQRIDLVTESEYLPSDWFDLIVHVHVLEHLPCNYTAVLYHLHRSLKLGGLHAFGVPIHRGAYAAQFGEIQNEDRAKQFGQADHMRRFGLNDLDRTLGMVFHLRPPDLVGQFGIETLKRHRIPESSWIGVSSNTIFALAKDDLRLKG